MTHIVTRFLLSTALLPGMSGTYVLIRDSSRFEKLFEINGLIVKTVGRGGRDRFVRDDELESDDRLPLVSRSNPVAAAFEFSFANLRKRVFRRLHPRVRG